MNQDNLLQQKDIEMLQKQLIDLNTTVNQNFGEIKSELKILRDSYVKAEHLEEKLKMRDEKIESLQDNQKWLVRTVIGVIIVSVLGAFLTLK